MLQCARTLASSIKAKRVLSSTTRLLSTAPLVTPRDATLIPGKYIVKFKGEFSANAVGETTASLAQKPDYTYTIFNGFAGTLSDEEVAKLKANPAVEYIEQESQVQAHEYQSESGAPWGLGRISHAAKGNTTYVYDSTGGEGVCAYGIDTGILTSHPEFEGRATWLENFTGDGDDTDGYGHGTHVAGTIGSKTYGVAKKVSLFAVKVLDASGSRTSAGVIAGIDYVASDSQTRSCPAGSVANMSLGGGKQQTVNDAVAAAVAAGVFFAVSAGNSNVDAKNSSPASEPSAFTVAASDINDAKASFSSFGPIVDGWAPGVNVLSTWNNGGTNTISGTSMASPHVAGLAAYLLAYEGLSTSAVGARILELANKGVVTGVPSGTVNALIYNGAPA